jgi:hypothetical protein
MQLSAAFGKEIELSMNTLKSAGFGTPRAKQFGILDKLATVWRPAATDPEIGRGLLDNQ